MIWNLAEVLATLISLLFAVPGLSWDSPIDHFECFSGKMEATKAEWRVSGMQYGINPTQIYLLVLWRVDTKPGMLGILGIVSFCPGRTHTWQKACQIAKKHVRKTCCLDALMKKTCCPNVRPSHLLATCHITTSLRQTLFLARDQSTQSLVGQRPRAYLKAEWQIQSFKTNRCYTALQQIYTRQQ